MLMRMTGHRGWGESIETDQPRLTWLTAVVFALFLFFTNAYISQTRLLWFDELNTLHIAKLPDLATLWRLQNSWGGDSAPISYAILTRLVYVLSGNSELSIRLLSNVAMIAATIVVFDCARRLKNGKCGLMAMFVLCGSFLHYYGFEGRPYSLVVLLTAIALWLWLHTNENNTAAAVAFGAAVFFVITIHFYGVLALTPFALWHFWHKHWRRPSPKIVAGAAGMLCALVLCAQQIQSGANWTAQSWCPPSAYALVNVYTQIFPYGVFTLAAFAVFLCATRTAAKPMSEAERFCWLFLTIPIAGFLVAELVTNHFFGRYFIAMLPGVSVASACFMSRYSTGRSSTLFIVLLAAIPVGQQLLFAQKAKSIDLPSADGQQSYTRKALLAERVILADGKKNVITGFLPAAEARHYSKHPALYVSFQPDDYLHYYCKDLSSTCWTLDKVKGHAREVAALYPSSTLLRAMEHAGFGATVQTGDPLLVYFSPQPSAASQLQAPHRRMLAFTARHALEKEIDVVAKQWSPANE